jgi:hypothetical protein
MLPGRGDVGGARRGASGRGAAVDETRLARSSGMAGGAYHASSTDVGAAGARRRAVLVAKALHSSRSALVAGRTPDCRLEHVGIHSCWLEVGLARIGLEPGGVPAQGDTRNRVRYDQAETETTTLVVMTGVSTQIER